MLESRWKPDPRGCLYKYYVCESGVSFDNKNEEVMTHGGISIDEVIVPFIKVKAVI